MENNRQQAIRDKGFDMGTSTKYGKIKVGLKSLIDGTLNLGSLTSGNRIFADKMTIMRALADRDLVRLRELSNYFYETNGIYQKVCNYFAYMYRYD